MSSFNKYKIAIESAKHINGRVRKLLHQVVAARKSNTEIRTRRSKIKSIGIIVSRHYSITDYYRILYDKDNKLDSNYNFLHSKNNQSDHNDRLLPD